MSKTILVVDDSTSTRAVMRSALEGAGYTVVEAADGVEAQGRLNGVSLVICDINMPRLDGMGFLKSLRANTTTRFTPLVFMTTESREERKVAGRALGATAWVTKPCSPSKLVDVARRLCTA